ncbi:MAG: hypothetical protein CMO81_00380 [Waddliaceae bacterium]|nr:hypothetical protein [Waddliaceae bacterium]
MPDNRFFTHDNLYKDAIISLHDREAHHIARVMRKKIGDKIELINGRGQLAFAELSSIQKYQVDVTVKDIEEKPKSLSKVILAQAIPRAKRLDMILEKSTELGVDEIWLFPGARSEKVVINESQEQRMQAILIASIKQCGRLHLPEIKIKKTLDKWDQLIGTAYFGDIAEDAPLFSDKWIKAEKESSTLFFVGPESGFTDAEHKKLRKLGANGVKLHNNILRTDTAPIVALSLIQHWIMKDLAP